MCLKVQEYSKIELRAHCLIFYQNTFQGAAAGWSLMMLPGSREHVHACDW